MINLDRIEQAIAVMKRAGAVDMASWQSRGILETEAELHSCGNSACFAGWLAVSPEFRAAGGRHLSNSGAPIFNGHIGHYAISEWFEAEDELHKEAIELLVTGEGTVHDPAVQWLKSIGVEVEADKFETGDDYSYAYLVGWDSYKAQDVIKFLEALRDE